MVRFYFQCDGEWPIITRGCIIRAGSAECLLLISNSSMLALTSDGKSCYVSCRRWSSGGSPPPRFAPAGSSDGRSSGAAHSVASASPPARFETREGASPEPEGGVAMSVDPAPAGGRPPQVSRWKGRYCKEDRMLKAR